MANVNHQNKDGNTPLHYGLLHGTSYEIFECLVNHGTDLTIRNKMGRSVFHLAAKHYHSFSEATGLLLEHGACVNEIDDLGSSVLHEALKNPSVNIQVIEKLLKNGAYPDFRDNTGRPPLAYCDVSTFHTEEKKLVEKMLIQYSVLRKMSLIPTNFSYERFGNAVVCFHFCRDSYKLNEWIRFRDSCIDELSEIGKVNLWLDYSLLQFLNDSNNSRMALTLFNLKTILSEVQEKKYPIFREKLLSAIEQYCYEDLIEDLFSLDLTAVTTTGIAVNMSLECIHKVFKFLPKRDTLNFILAFYMF